MSDLALYAPTTLRKSKSGLWAFEALTPSNYVTKVGYMTKQEAKTQGTDFLLQVFGRVPRYIHEDKE